MFLTISSVVLGILITAGIMHLRYAHQTEVLKCDYLAAVRKQAEDSYRTGYMNGMLDEKDEHYRKNSAKNLYQSLTV